MMPPRNTTRFFALLACLSLLLPGRLLFAQDAGAPPIHLPLVVNSGAPAAPATSPPDTLPAAAPAAVPAADTPGALLGDVATLSAGYAHTCALTNAGGVKCWGDNSSGQLGDGTTVSRVTPSDVVGLESGVQAINAGYNHTCAVTAAGGVKCWGDNSFGQLGDGTTVNRVTPADVLELATGVQAISAGGGHTCALRTDRLMMCWGKNDNGQLATGDRVNRLSPTSPQWLINEVQAIATGGNHTCILLSAARRFCWGDNEFGQLGDGTKVDSSTPRPVNGIVGEAVAIDAGDSHTCVLTTYSRVMCWGYKYSNDPESWASGGRPWPTDIAGIGGDTQSLSTGYAHTCALITGGGVTCWWRNNGGQLGDGTTTDRLAPAVVQGLGSGVLAVSSGGEHSCALTTSGGVKCWGNNSAGQLGDGATLDRLIVADAYGLASGVQAVSAGSAHTCALMAAGGVKCWGDNSAGALGDGTTSPPQWRPRDVVGLAGALQAVSAGASHTCALNPAGGVVCWGGNGQGQLGNGTLVGRSTPGAVLGLSSGVQAVGAGDDHTCALTTAGGVLCWGDNSTGKLGNGTTINASAPVEVSGLESGVQAISVGPSHTCALTTSGGVACWGSNDFGELGDGTTGGMRATQQEVLGLGSGVLAIGTGQHYTCALTTAGVVKCWGNDPDRNLGDGEAAHYAAPVEVIGLGSDILAISVGLSHACALDSSGGVKCWGSSDHNQLGNVTLSFSARPYVVGLQSGVLAVSAGSSHSCALTTAGGVKCWGRNAEGQLAVNPGRTPVDVISGAPAATHRVAGRITVGGVGLAGVLLTTEGGSATTDANGDFAIAGLATGFDYTLTPSRSGYSFEPPSRPFPLFADLAAADFTAQLLPPITYAIGGRVTLNGAALAGVVISAGSASAVTAADGAYTLAGLEAGAYALTPAKSGYRFTPPVQAIELAANIANVDFAAQLLPPVTYTMSGRITLNGAGLEGVTVSTGSRSATTNANGDYTFSGLPAGAYVLTPAKASYLFSPATRAVNVNPSVSNLNFTAARPPILLIPDVMGSQLTAQQSSVAACAGRPSGVVWLNLPEVGPLDALRLADDGRTSANGCDAISAAGTVDQGDSAAGLGDLYRSFAAAFPGWNVAPFTYDWRLAIDDPNSANDTVGKLDAYIAGRYGTTPVILVGHGMGGLVARAYVADAQRAARVAKVITVGTPYLGAPKIAALLMAGKADLLKPSHLWEPWAADAQAIARNAPGILALLPGRTYANAYPYLTAGGTRLNGFDATHEWYRTRGANAQLLAGAADFHSRYDSLAANLPFSGAYWVLAARDANTISGLSQVRCGATSGWCYGITSYAKGDGAVPEQSSRLLPQAGALVGSARLCTYSGNVLDHAALLTDAAVRQDILRILLEQPPTTCVSDASGMIAADSVAALPSLREVVVRGEVDVRVENGAGGWVGLGSAGFVTGTLTDVTMEFLPGATVVTMPQGAGYRVVLRAAGATSAAATASRPVTLVVSNFAAPAPEALMTRQAQALFATLNMPSSGQLTLPAAGAALNQLTLLVDANSDGTPEQIHQPQAVLTDPAQAQDALAPVTVLGATGAQDSQGRFTGAATVTISAADATSGVLRSYYSIDGGQTWREYRSPFALTVADGLQVQAYSVDRAGNQEYPPQLLLLPFAAEQRVMLPLVRR